eukprot:gene5831-6072_t
MPAALSSQDEVRKQSAETVPVVAGGLSSYEIGPAIGKGGYAVVYKGIRRQDGLVVAIKRVDIDTMAAKKRERCIKEVHLLQQLNHPHILTCHDAFIDQQQLIIVTEWAPGGDMKRLIRRLAQAGKCFEEAEIWHYLRQVVDALQALHAARILHRDVKPANVLVCSGGVLKLGDLGLGRKLGPQTVDVLSKVGTPYYVSPEVVKGVKYDFKSDMWSLGCLLYELAMLKSPFEKEGANLNDVFQKISKGEYDPLPANRLSPALRSLTNALLSQEPHSRPSADLVLQHMTSMQEVLQQKQVAAAKSNSSQGWPSKSAGRSSKASSGKALVAGAVVLPVDNVLQQLHPLFFAMSPLAFGGCYPNNCLTAAGVLRSAGESLVTQECLQAAPTAELAVGYGRAVCVLLQAVLDRAWSHLKLTCRRCMHAPEAYGDVADSRLQEQLVDDVPADLVDLAQHTPEVEEASYSEVDAAAWYAETESVAIQLKQMPGLLAAYNTDMQHQQTWLTSLPALRHLQCQFSQLVPEVKEALAAVAGRATNELERQMQQEQALLRTFAEPLGQHALLRHELDALLQRRQQKEDCVLSLQQQLSAVSGRLEQVQQQVANRAEVLQGSQLLHQQQMAVQQLRQEINNMELKLGLLQHQLFACKQRRQLHQVT